MPSRSPEPSEKPAKKPRRWRRIFVVLLLLAAILLPLLNGPIFRKVTHWQLGKVFHNLYLNGDFEVEGSILGGVGLRDVNLTGTRNLQSLTLSHAEVKFDLLPLIRGKWGEGVTRLHLHDIGVAVDTSKNFPTDPEIEARKKAKGTKKSSKGKPSTLWTNLDQLLQQDIAIENLNVSITSPDKPVFELNEFSFLLDGGDGSITSQQITYPNGETTRNLNAKLDSAGEKIIKITSLGLAEELSIDRLTIEKPIETSVATQLPRLSGEIRVLGGHISAQQQSPTISTAKLDRGHIDLAALSRWLEKDFGVSGKITTLDIVFDSEAAHPIHADIVTEEIAYKQFGTDTISASIDYRSDEVKLEALSVVSGENSIRASGNYQLEQKLVSAELIVDAPNLAQLAERFELPKFGGALSGKIDLKLSGGDFADTTASLVATRLSYQDYTLATTNLDAQATADGPITFALVGNVDAERTNTFEIPGEFNPKTKFLRAEPSIDIPDLAKLTRLVPEAPPLKGSVTGGGSLRLDDGVLDVPQLKLDVQNLVYKQAKISKLRLSAKTTGPNQLDFAVGTEIDASGQNYLESNGAINLDTLRYDAEAKLNLPDLAVLHPILNTFEIEQHPTGKFFLGWDGAGAIREKEHRGKASISDFALRLDDGDPILGKLDLQYSPDTYHLTNLNVRNADLTVSGAAHLADQRLEIESLRLFSGERSIARADVSIPFDQSKVSDLETFLDQPGKVSINIESDQMQLSKLMAMSGKPASLGAVINANIDVQGTLADPTGTGDLDVLQLRSLSSNDLAPADLNLDFKLGGGQIVLDGRLQHPEIQPITIKGNTPLRPKNLGDFADQSINLELKLPQTGLALAEKYIPDLTTAEGTVAADVRINGTASAPKLAGDIFIKAPLLKWKQQKIPTLSDMDIAIHLQDKRVAIRNFSGYLAGGKLDITGAADLETLANPLLDVSLKADQVLLFRDDSISLRANADIKLAGPYEKAALAGKIGITQSRFFREIEILPIGLPRSSPTPAAPKAPSFGTKKDIGVAASPFNAWTVDVDIVTDDPFLVRSNLARADILVKLNIGGTLGKPIPHGKVTLEDGKATLPFSELETTQAELTFSQKTGFDPEINVRAVSKVQDYNINLIAYGRSSTPKTLITSDPPLPESEALALLASGSKSSDLNDSKVIAGDAALLLIDRLRRKYGKGTPIERRPGSLRELLSFKAGQIDPRTGKRAASAELELTDRVYLLGNVDVEGDYRGLVKFIFRFK